MCPICLADIYEEKQLECGDKFCSSCIERALECRSVCPVCQVRLGPEKGNQPPGKMTYYKSPISLSGNAGHGTIAIFYIFNDGIQMVSMIKKINFIALSTDV